MMQIYNDRNYNQVLFDWLNRYILKFIMTLLSWSFLPTREMSFGKVEAMRQETGMEEVKNSFSDHQRRGLQWRWLLMLPTVPDHML